MAQPQDEVLKALCEQASQEQDPRKLVELTEKINALLQAKRESKTKQENDEKVA